VAAAVAAGLLFGAVLQIANIGTKPESTRDEVEIAKGAPLREEAPAAAAGTKARRQSERAKKVNVAAAPEKEAGEKAEAMDRRSADRMLESVSKKGADRPAPATALAPADATDKPFSTAEPHKNLTGQLKPGVPPPPSAPAMPAAPKPPAPVTPAEPDARPAPVIAKAEAPKKTAADPFAPVARPTAPPPVMNEPDSPAAPPAATAPAARTRTASKLAAKAKEVAPDTEMKPLKRIGAATPAPEKAPDVVLAARSTDIDRDTALLNQLAYGGRVPRPDSARSIRREKADQPEANAFAGKEAPRETESRRAVADAEGKTGAVDLVYDLDEREAQRFMAALAARPDLKVSIVSVAPVDTVRTAGIRDAVAKLQIRALRDKMALAKAEEKQADLRSGGAVVEAERGARKSPVADAGPTPELLAPSAAKPAAKTAPGGAAPAAGGAPEPPQADPAAQAGPAADAKDATPARRVRIVVRLLPR
jgi:hypothetical protein